MDSLVFLLFDFYFDKALFILAPAICSAIIGLGFLRSRRFVVAGVGSVVGGFEGIGFGVWAGFSF